MQGTSRCDTCNKVFEQEMGLSRPEVEGSKFDTYPKEFSVKSSLSLYKCKMPYKCETFDAVFVQKYKYVGRQQSDLVRNQFVCQTSSEALCRESHLSAHEKIHRDDLATRLRTHAIAVTEQEHLNAHRAVHKRECLS